MWKCYRKVGRANLPTQIVRRDLLAFALVFVRETVQPLSYRGVAIVTATFHSRPRAAYSKRRTRLAKLRESGAAEAA